MSTITIDTTISCCCYYSNYYHRINQDNKISMLVSYRVTTLYCSVMYECIILRHKQYYNCQQERQSEIELETRPAI